MYTLNLKSFKFFKVLVENPFKKCVFLHFYNNKCIIMSYFQVNPLPYERGGDFIGGCTTCFLFSFIWQFFMNHKHEAQWP
jgi:hypothetical protein